MINAFIRLKRLALTLACLFVGLPILGLSAPIKTNAPKKIQENLVTLARVGDVNAQYQLGSKSYFGIGCETNYVDAFYWFRRAAEGGLSKAQYRLGYMLCHGLGTETNLPDAYKWLKAAETQGDAGAGALAIRLEPQIKKLEEERLRLAEQAHAARVPEYDFAPIKYEAHPPNEPSGAFTGDHVAVQHSSPSPSTSERKTPPESVAPESGSRRGSIVWVVVGAFVFLWLIGKVFFKKQPAGSAVTIAASPVKQKRSSSGAHLEWLGPGASLQINGLNITDPLVYASKGTSADDEASCIDQSLPVGRPILEPRGALGYWPRYAGLSPNQRANYLAWLATGRKADIEDVGYVFLFFYGLERRALVENQDIELVLNETNRLLHKYSDSRSLLGYGSNFMAYLLARLGLENLPKEAFDAVFRDSLKKFTEDTLSVCLAWLNKAGEPLPSYIAYEVARSDIRSSSSVVVRRVPDQLRALFAKKYEQRFGPGMMLEASARDRMFEYRPASPSLVSWNTVHFKGFLRIPNVLAKPGQFKPLVELWEECIEELKPLSREVGKGKDVFTREAYSALPDELKAEVDHPDKEKWDAFVTGHTEDNAFALVSAGALGQLSDMPERPRMTLNQSISVAQTASDVGYVVVPDPRLTEKAFKWNDLIAIFRPEGRAQSSTDKQYMAVSLLLELGVAVAAADGEIENEEMAHISNFLKSQFMLEPDDTSRLAAYRAVLIKQPPSLASITKRLKASLDSAQIEKIGQFLVGIAAADGTLARQERTTLRKVYTALGIEIARLDELIVRLCGTPIEPVEIQKANVDGKVGEPLPSRTQPLIIDESVVRSILQETEAVAHMLSSVLAEHGDEEVEPVTAVMVDSLESTSPTSESTAPQDEPFKGLDSRYHSILQAILASQQWSKAEFYDLARKHGLMPGAVYETINSWSDETLGDFLIEEGEPYVVRRELLENT